MKPADLKKLSKEQRESISSYELRSKYGIRGGDSYIMKIGLRHYDVLSNSSLKNEEMIEMTGLSKFTVSNCRHVMLFYKVIDRKTAKLGSVKRLQIQRNNNNINRFVYINSSEMRAAKLEPDEEYFCSLVPRDHEITIKFNDKKLAEYAGKTKSQT